MADDLNGCECIWSPALVMQQLLSLMRQQQDNCNDIECFSAPARLSQTTTGTDESGFASMFIFMIIAMIMYLMGSNPLRGITKTKRRNSNDDLPPPSSPPSVN